MVVGSKAIDEVRTIITNDKAQSPNECQMVDKQGIAR